MGDLNKLFGFYKLENNLVKIKSNVHPVETSSIEKDDWDYYSENGVEEAFETNTILERLRKKQPRRRK